MLLVSGGILLAVCLSTCSLPSDGSKKELLQSLAATSRPIGEPSLRPTRRGRPPAQLGAAGSFHLGVAVVELRLAANRPWDIAAAQAADSIRGDLANIEAPELRELTRSILRTEGAERIARIELLDELLTGSRGVIDTSYYSLGGWVSAAWHLLEIGRTDLLPGLEDDSSFPGIAGEAEGVRDRILELLRSGQLERAQKNLEIILEEGGRLD